MKEIENIYQELLDITKYHISKTYREQNCPVTHSEPMLGINNIYYTIKLDTNNRDINLLSDIFNIIKHINTVTPIDWSLDQDQLIIRHIDDKNPIIVSKLDLIYNQCVKSQIKSEYDGEVIKLYLDYIDYHHSVSYLNAFVESIKDLYDNIDIFQVSNPSEYRNVYYIREKKLLFSNINRF